MNKATLLTLGLAAFAFYRYNKMSNQEKAQLKDKLRDAGKGLTDKVPTAIKKKLGMNNTLAESF